MTPAAPSKSLLGTSTKPLRMRICGTAHDGQIVSVQASKVTIGSSRQCTVRLRSPQIAPVQCLILRGPGRAVVRRWTANTCLNHAAFEDSLLHPGDRLTVGPVELEILGDEAGLDAGRETTATDSHSSSDLEQIQRRWAELEANLQSLDQQRQQWRTTQSQDEQSLVERRRKLDEEQRQFDLRVEQFEDQQRQLEQHGRDQQLLVATQISIEDGQRALAGKQQAVDEQLRAVERERESLDQQLLTAKQAQEALGEREDLVTERERTLEAQQQAVQQQNTVLEERQTSFSKQQQVFEQQLKSVGQQQESLDEQHQSLEQQQEMVNRQLQSLTERQQTVEHQRRMLDEGQTAIGQQLEAFKVERKTWDTQQTQLRRDLEERDEHIAQLSVELEEMRSQHAAERKADDSRHDVEQTAALQQRVAELESQCAQLALQRDKNAENCEQFEQELAALREQNSGLQTVASPASESESNSAATLLDEPHAAIAQEPPRRTSHEEDSTHDEHEMAAEESSDAPSIADTPTADEEAVFARLRAMSLLKENQSSDRDDESASSTLHDNDPEAVVDSMQSPESNQQEDKEAAPSEMEQSIEEPQLDAVSAEPANLHSDDDSIDDYMTKLLERMRGMSDGGPSPAHQTATPPRQLEPKVTATAAENSPITVPIQSPAKLAKLPKFEPRSAAPEKTHDLAAMREIANLSARAAIATHHHRHGTNRAWTTVFVGGFSILLGIVLLCMTPHFVSMITLCGLGGLGTGIYFLVQSRSLLHSLQLSEHHKQLQLEEIAREQHLPKNHQPDHPMPEQKEAGAPPTGDPAEE